MAYVYIVIMVIAGYAAFVVPTRWLRIERIRYPLGIGKKILQISDVHVEMLRIRPGKIKRILQTENPDYLFITGDFTQNEKYIPRLEPYLEIIRDSGIPAYAVLGNHDYRLADVGVLVQTLRSYGVAVLRNESVQLDDFQLIGIDDYCTRHSDIDRAFRDAVPGKPKLIMTHDPNIVLEIRNRYDYLLSGHLHGKQFNVPFLFKLKYKGELPLRGIYKGLHHSQNGTFYISKGIGQAGLNLRFLVRSEITFHYL